MKKIISIVTPTYNEELNIEKMVLEIEKIMFSLRSKYEYEHIVIDNKSTDNTIKILKNIAKKADVSIATVSRILRKKNLKNKPNEIKVLKIARELGYPYIHINQIKSKKKKIALILKMESGEFYSSLFNGIHHASLRLDLQLSLISIKDGKQPISEIIDIINDYHASIIFLPFLTQSDY